jgi:predicted aspartyl protease
MPSISITYNPSVGPLIQVAIWAPNYRPAQPSSASPLQMNMYAALVDTGASCTCISQKVIQDIGLNPIGKQQVGHAQGISAANSYQFQVVFAFPQSQGPTGTIQANLMAHLVMGVEFLPQPGSTFDVLLGRDVICKGNFSMSFDGHAILSL